MDGVININKPAGWTSQDVCAKLRSMLHIKKIGHTGTLDPMATGVLPVCIGKATRIIEYYDGDYKSYHAAMRLGITTDTLDITGEVIETQDYSKVAESDVREAFEAYRGTVMQVPPKYSAIRVGGRRAYELAREGKDFDIKPREVEITKNEIMSIDLEQGLIEFDVSCSKGTYIRTICDDIGKDLGCGAAMTSLVRTASGFFKIEDSVELSDLLELSDSELNEKIATLIIPMDETLTNLGVIELDNNRLTAFKNGNSSNKGCYRISKTSSFNDYYCVYVDAKYVGIAEISKLNDEILVPKKVLLS